jgi:hypothetical protein
MKTIVAPVWLTKTITPQPNPQGTYTYQISSINSWSSSLNRRYQTTRYTTTWNSPWFVPQTVLKLDKLSIRGVVYASAESLPRDSNVIFRKPGDPTLRIGKINTIFSSSHREANYQERKVTCLVVEEWVPVADPAAQQTYQQFGFAGGFLCQNRLVETVSVVDRG